jgi:hypothetical protein
MKSPDMTGDLAIFCLVIYFSGDDTKRGDPEITLIMQSPGIFW